MMTGIYMTMKEMTTKSDFQCLAEKMKVVSVDLSHLLMHIIPIGLI